MLVYFRAKEVKVKEILVFCLFKLSFEFFDNFFAGFFVHFLDDFVLSHNHFLGPGGCIDFHS